LIASVAAEDAYKAADLLMDKLDRLLARRDAMAGKRRHRLDKVAAAGV
jgi:ribosome-associated translation inhibitor RaiA